MKSYISVDERCPECGGEVIHKLPGISDSADVQAKSGEVKTPFLLPYDGEARVPGHPGRYCPKGCFAVMYNLGSKDWMKEMDRERDARETASILVILRPAGIVTLETIKLYLNRNVRTNGSTGEASYLSITLEPGTHTLIARDYDHHDPNRRESKLIKFTIGEGQCLLFYVDDENGSLKLTQDEPDDAGKQHSSAG